MTRVEMEKAGHEENYIKSEVDGEAWQSISEVAQAELSRLFERTTVTNKLRRIARWDHGTMRESAMLNRPSEVSLTFLNYVFPEAWGCTRVSFGYLPVERRRLIYGYVCDRMTEMGGAHIGLVSFGPLEENTFRLYSDEVMSCV